MFWTIWHALGVAAVVSVPAFYVWGETVAGLQPDALLQAVAMGAAYLALATVVALVRPGRSPRGILDVVVAGGMTFGAALVLLALRPDLTPSRAFVVFSALLATALVLLPIVLQDRRRYGFALHAGLALSIAVSSVQQPSGPVRLQVVFPARSLSKVPFVIAYEQGLFEKYGLNVSIWMPPKEGESDIPPSRSARPERPDILVDGHSPIIYRMVTEANFPAMIALAGGDCMARMHIVGQRGLARLEDLKGKRLGVNRSRSTSAYVARLLVRRMGWDPLFDISILEFGFDADSLRTGAVDAIVAPERAFAQLQAEGYPVLANSLDWNEAMAGNSVLVERDWLKVEGHRDAALRFLKASAEGFALFHRDPELARRVMARWNGIMGDELGETIYDRGDSFPRKPYPCYDGIRKTMELYDSNEMRRYAPEDFYDDSLMRELENSGFLDSLYK